MSDSILNQELMAIFFEETETLINEMIKDLTILNVNRKVGKQDEYNIYDRLHRCAHTIKGSAAVVGFSHLEEISHVMENVFFCGKEGTFKTGKAEFELLMEGVEVCNRLLRKENISDYREKINCLREMIK